MKKILILIAPLFLVFCSEAITQNNYVTQKEIEENRKNCDLKVCESFAGKTFTAVPNDYQFGKFHNSTDMFDMDGFRVRSPEKFTIIKLVAGKFQRNIKDSPLNLGYYEIKFESGKKCFVGVGCLYYVTGKNREADVGRKLDEMRKK